MWAKPVVPVGWGRDAGLTDPPREVSSNNYERNMLEPTLIGLKIKNKQLPNANHYTMLPRLCGAECRPLYNGVLDKS